MPLRKIASNRLWTPEGWFAHPLLEVDAGGCLRSVERCPAPDRMAGTEFHAGILLPGPADGAPCAARPCGDPAEALSPACGAGDASRSEDGAGGRAQSLSGSTDAARQAPASVACDAGPFPSFRLSQGIAGASLASERPDRVATAVTVVVDRELAPQEAGRIEAHFPVPVRWCLSFALDEALFCRMAGLLLRRGACVCAGDGSPAEPAHLARLALAQQRSDLPLHDLLGWIAGDPAAAGSAAARLRPGCRCGLWLLSGLDYERMRLTDRSRLRRIL